MKKRNKKSLSIQYKFFLCMFLSSSSLIFLLMILTIGIFFQHFIKREVFSSSQQLEYISQQLQFYLDSVDNYSKTIISDSIIQDGLEHFYSYPKEDHYSLFLLLKEKVNHIIQSTDYIYSVSMYNRKKQLLFSTESFEIKTELEHEFDSQKGIWIASKKYSKLDNKKLIQTFSFIRPFYSYSTGKKFGFLEITIPESAIFNIYCSQTLDPNQIIIVDKEGIIQSSSHLLLGTSYNNWYKIQSDRFFSYYIRPNAVIFSIYFPHLDWFIINELKPSLFFQSTYTVLFLFISTVFICLLVYLPFAHKLSRTITIPLLNLTNHTKTIRNGQWKTIELIKASREVEVLFDAFNHMILAQEQLKNELIETQIIKDKIKLDLLQEQINPHFLYNTLDNICSLAEVGETELLIDIVMNLSAFYRNTLGKGQSYITLKEELDLTEAYLHILQIRHFNKFRFQINCCPSLYSTKCLKLLLQPMVENSIYHGIRELDETGLIEISVKEETSYLIITIEDNGVGISKEKEKAIWNLDTNHFGLRNIHERIQLYYGSHCGLTIQNKETHGCITTITIKKEMQQCLFVL